MNLYVLFQSVNNGWNTFDRIVVCAFDGNEAQMMHPLHDKLPHYRGWDGKAEQGGYWCDAKDVEVHLLGVAADGWEKGVVCASFNAA